MSDPAFLRFSFFRASLTRTIAGVGGLPSLKDGSTQRLEVIVSGTFDQDKTRNLLSTVISKLFTKHRRIETL